MVETNSGDFGQLEIIHHGNQTSVGRSANPNFSNLAVKFATTPVGERLLESEFSALMALQDVDGIIPVISVDIDVPGVHFAMPLIDQSLHQLGRVPWRVAARICASLAGTVASMHERGWMHGDIKPGNVLLEGGERPVLIDFGSAQSLRADREPATATFAFTPSYASSELRLGLSPTAASDVFGVGATLFFLLTGRAPTLSETASLSSATLTTLPTSALHSVEVRLDGLPPAVPRPLVALLAAALEQDPEARPSASELQRFLRQVTLLGDDADHFGDHNHSSPASAAGPDGPLTAQVNRRLADVVTRSRPRVPISELALAVVASLTASFAYSNLTFLLFLVAPVIALVAATSWKRDNQRTADHAERFLLRSVRDSWDRENEDRTQSHSSVFILRSVEQGVALGGDEIDW